LGTPSGCRWLEKIKNKNKILFFLVVVAGWKKGQKIFQFSVFNPQDPRVPRVSEFPELCGLRGRSHEKKKVFLA
jgi:hypothetical protein